ncbi:GNAT family N-acetyltransferase [Arthrobacter silvisoli]|uniref:GNAT family N-acetyltransferase n=1 Tax=Arthrobacter silvisoli TaxID=2291022 RepID=UPI000E20E131|nr:GNAT family N-acetyltransferase [Arthrobacter silvisoli]
MTELPGPVPDTVPLPDPQATGLRWRAAGTADIEAWAALIARTAAVEQPVWYEKAADLDHVLQSSKNDPAVDTLLGFDTDGVARAYGRVDKNPDGGKAFGFACVDPAWQHRGIGTAILAWQEGRTRRRFADDAGQHGTAEEPPVPRLRLFMEEKMLHQSALFEARGFDVVRWYNEMHRPLDGSLPDVSLAPGLELLTLEPGLHEGARLAHNDAFRDHWGSEPRDEEAWRFIMEGPLHREDLSTVVRDTASGEIAGYQIALFDPDAAAARGYKEGYTELLGVRRQYRGRGVASSLLADAMHRFVAAGMDVASLDVDSENPTGALALYVKMGYAAVNRSMAWDKVL